MKPTTHKKSVLKTSDEPLWWAIFSGGGVCFALFLPAIILFFGLFLPLELIEIGYQTAHNWLFSIWGLLVVGAGVVLPAFHAAHRIRHGLQDLKVQHHSRIKVICYGLATLLSLLCLGLWFFGVLI